MTTGYPAIIDTNVQLPTQTDNVSGVSATSVNNLQGAIFAIEQTLGIKPQGNDTTVVNRLNILESLIGAGGGAGAGQTVQTGYNYGKFLNIYPFPGQTNTASTTFVTAGTFEFDPTIITAPNGIRTIVLRLVAETTGPLMTIQLFNITTASIVSGTTLTTSSTTPILLQTADLTSALSNSLSIYQIQINMAAGSNTDRAVLDMAILKITWS